MIQLMVKHFRGFLKQNKSIDSYEAGDASKMIKTGKLKH